jgi:protein-L-isoaspartate(D-aspartate) O-methyltransferase
MRAATSPPRSLAFITMALLLGACTRRTPSDPPAATRDAGSDAFAPARYLMVRDHLEARGIRDARVLFAMRRVPREEFVPPEARALAYEDHPLPIGHAQTISQPYVVATMTQAARLSPGDRVLEVGTGSGYQAAVLAELGAEVYSIEIVEPLGEQAAAVLSRLGYRVHTRLGDGYRGWPEAAPFEAIVVTAAPAVVPQPLLDQLADGGRLVIPVGEEFQELRVITRRGAELQTETLFPVRFVPMTGEARDAR